MTTIDLNAATAIDLIKRSVLMHPTLFMDHLAMCLSNDLAYADKQPNSAIKRSVMASAKAYKAAIDAIEADEVESLTGTMGAGIVALNVACKLQCIPPHVRAAAALRTWPEG